VVKVKVGVVAGARAVRLYFFNNMYLSSIQNGIQAGHVAVELMKKYGRESKEWGDRIEAVHDWAENHKTFIVLNGGGTPTMHEIKAHLESPENPYPFAFFNEPDADGLLSSVCILLPERMYDELSSIIGSDKFDERAIGRYSSWEIKFLELKSKCRMAS
jgi:hypothetical protein